MWWTGNRYLLCSNVDIWENIAFVFNRCNVPIVSHAWTNDLYFYLLFNIIYLVCTTILLRSTTAISRVHSLLQIVVPLHCKKKISASFLGKVRQLAWMERDWETWMSIKPNLFDIKWRTKEALGLRKDIETIQKRCHGNH